MTAMTQRRGREAGDAMPWWARAPDAPFTVDDLDATPDDGRRYELVDGSLLVTPRPSVAHQAVVSRLLSVLAAAAPPDLRVLAGPVGVRLAEGRLLAPDLVVVPARVARGGRWLSEPPLLVVEVRSRSAALVDRTLKRAAYAEAGVPSYWLVDPDPPSFVALALGSGGYAEVARVRGDEAAQFERPFPVEVVPGALVG